MPDIMRYNKVLGKLLRAILGISTELAMVLFIVLAALAVSWLVGG